MEYEQDRDTSPHNPNARLYPDCNVLWNPSSSSANAKPTRYDININTASGNITRESDPGVIQTQTAFISLMSAAGRRRQQLDDDDDDDATSAEETSAWKRAKQSRLGPDRTINY